MLNALLAAVFVLPTVKATDALAVLKAGLPLSTAVVRALEARGLDDVVVIVGGIISPAMAEKLREVGIEGAFGPGTSIDEIAQFTRDQVAKKRGAPA